MGLKCLPEQDRPRERLAKYGSDHLSTIELLAILLGSGTQSRSVLELASDLLVHFRTVNNLADASIEELEQVKGIGQAKAIQLKAAFALLSRIESQEKGLLLNSAEKAYQLVAYEMQSQKVETLMVILRDVKKCYLHKEVIAKGTLTDLLLHPREIFHYAIRHRAHSVILAHNHPSGDPTPSLKDVEMTRILVGAGKVVGIELADHLIIGRDSYISFFEKNMMIHSGVY